VRSSAAIALLALFGARVDAQAPPDPVNCTALCPDGHYAPTLCASSDDPCGGGGTSSNSAEASREAAARFAAEVDEAVRGSSEEQQRALRRANDRGIDAFKHKQWDLAVQAFEGAQRLDPSSALVAENLQRSREEQAAERARRAAATAPIHASDLRLPPPPSPIPPPPSPPLAIALGSARDAWARTVPAFDLSQRLAPWRQAARDAAALLPDFLKSALFDGMAEHAKIAPHHWVELIQSTADLSAQANKLATGLIDTTASEIYTGTDQSGEAGAAVTQFATDNARESIWGHVKAWGSHRAAKGPGE
jgi:hypothetical protein